VPDGSCSNEATRMVNELSFPSQVASLCCLLIREPTIPGSIAPERVPILEVEHLDAGIDALAVVAVSERLAGSVDIHRAENSLLSDHSSYQMVSAVLRQTRYRHFLGWGSGLDVFP
jgi:hypothetical protein